MERRLNNKATQYVSGFKTDIKNHAIELGIEDEKFNSLVQYIYDYNTICFTAEDFTKRKRVKNVVPLYERCSAKRANDEQCTRRKKEGFEYCGTHLKGTPNGAMSTDETDVSSVSTQRVEVWGQDIMGITYYIDSLGNVYETEDVVMNKHNPKIIARYVKINDEYSIPEFETR
jgi:hypothetical protein